MQQKEVLILSVAIIIGVMMFLWTQQQTKNTITGALGNEYCGCPYKTGDEFIDSDFQLKDGTWLWNFMGVLWSDSSPRYVAHASWCLPRTNSEECWTWSCWVILGNGEVREYRCGWPPSPQYF